MVPLHRLLMTERSRMVFLKSHYSELTLQSPQKVCNGGSPVPTQLLTLDGTGIMKPTPERSTAERGVTYANTIIIENPPNCSYLK
jgi:hypothetical protein